MAGLPLLTDNHVRQPIHAHRWLREGRAFRMIYWWAEHRRRMSDGEVVQALERLASRHDAFTYAIEYIKPER